MKLKLNHQQLLALYNYFTELLNGAGTRQTFYKMEARLCFLLLYSIYTKLHALVMPATARVKPKYTLTLDEKDQLSFFLFFTQVPVPDHHPLAALLVAHICNEINKQYV